MMKRLICWLLLSSWITIALAMPAKVLRILDGDTLEIDAGMWVIVGGEAKQMRSPLLVRVVGVDTPELRAKQPCERELALRARKFVQDWIGNGSVELIIVGLDKYSGRIDAHVLRVEQSLANALIAAGLGRAYDGGLRGPWC